MVTVREAERLGRSRGLAGLGSLTAFELPAIGGGTVRSWDYRSREHLVVVLTGTAPDLAVLEELARRQAEVRAEDAALLVVFLTEAGHAQEWWERSGRPGQALADADGRVHERLGAAEPEVLVVDRDGTIYWRALLSDAPAERLLGEAIGWLQYMNILEHECGTCVPAWPDEDLP